MAPRATFKGFLRLSLVSVPVKCYTASVSGSEIRLNQLHSECHSRIKYQKTCPTHGTVAADEIVSGYEYAKGQYVIVDPEELKQLRKQSDKSVDIAGFVSADQIDPMYFSGRTYYMLPDGAVGQKPYQLMRDVMQRKGLVGLATAVLSGREQLLCVRPVDDVMTMSVLAHHEKMKQPSAFLDEINEAKLTAEERKLTETLVAASMLEKFDYSSHRDAYVDQLTALIEAKVEGQEIVSEPDAEEPKVINLMEALKASVENARRTASGSKTTKRKAGKKKVAKKKKKIATKMSSSKRKTAAKKKRVRKSS